MKGGFMTIVVEVARQMGCVSGIKREDSKYSAERLREDVLIPTLRDLRPKERLCIVLDDKNDDSAYQYSHAYLEEAFVGLVKYGEMTHADFIHTLSFECHHKDNRFYVDKIFEISQKLAAKRKAEQPGISVLPSKSIVLLAEAEIPMKRLNDYIEQQEVLTVNSVDQKTQSKVQIIVTPEFSEYATVECAKELEKDMNAHFHKHKLTALFVTE